MNCPICAEDSSEIIRLKCSDFDGSPLYQDIRLKACDKCRHIFNELTEDEKNGLDVYYEEESSIINMSGSTFHGDLPGSDNTLSVMRYEQLYDFLSDHIQKEMKILDVGCGMGGFVRYLHQRGHANSDGLDYVDNYIRYAREKGPGNFDTASAYSLPYEDNSYDLVVLDHVLEHVVNPVQVMSEINRVVKPGGLLYIGVPESSLYGSYPFFDFFWLCLREHIHHFDAVAISSISRKFNFAPVDHSTIYTQMMSSKMILPNYLALFKSMSNGDETKPETLPASGSLYSSMIKYIETESVFLEKHRAAIRRLVEEQLPAFVWGVGKELFCLYANTDLSQCKDLILVDKNKVKQDSMKVDGRSIHAPSILGKAPKKSALIVTAIAHEESIINDAKMMGYEGDIITLGRK